VPWAGRDGRSSDTSQESSTDAPNFRQLRMTTARYRSYRRALEYIEMLEEHSAHAAGMRLLRQSAEDLLLSRGPAPDRDDPMDDAVMVLTQLVVTGAVSRALADAITETLHEAGPDGGTAKEIPASLSGSPSGAAGP
jgi:hypothetical protein